MPEVLVFPFTCSKEGNTSEENEDAYSVPDVTDGGEFFRFAIADGASESSFSREWATILVDHYYSLDYNEACFITTLHPILKRRWLNGINIEELPWYAKDKLELGSFSSFLGLNIDRETGNASLISVGDSNFFHFRNKKLQLAFPVKRSIDFGNRPFLISTESSKNKNTPLFAQEECKVIPGDFILLGTDACSQWILKAEEENRYGAINELTELLQQQDYDTLVKEWVKQMRSERFMKNDDTTIILIKIL